MLKHPYKRKPRAPGEPETWERIEQWAPIPETDGLLEVSDSGRVRSWRCKGRVAGRSDEPNVLSLSRHSRDGYLRVGLDRNTTRTVARLVWEAFIGPISPKAEVGYADGDRTNVRLTNLILQPHRGNRDGMMRGSGVRRGNRVGDGRPATP